MVNAAGGGPGSGRGPLPRRSHRRSIGHSDRGAGGRLSTVDGLPRLPQPKGLSTVDRAADRRGVRSVPTEGEPVPVLCMLNQKGGVGKTSTCHHLAGALASRGRRVLLVDLDPQASLTQGLWGPQSARALAAIRHRCGHPRRRRAVPRPTHPAVRDRADRPGAGLAPGQLVQPARPAPGRDGGPVAAPRVPRCRGPVPLRPSAARLPAEPVHVLVGGAGRQRLHRRPAPAGGLWRPGHHRHPGVDGAGRSSGSTPASACWGS